LQRLVRQTSRVALGGVQSGGCSRISQLYRGRICAELRFGFDYGDQRMRRQQNGCNHKNHNRDPQVQQKSN
jgi:hypothetical protein